MPAPQRSMWSRLYRGETNMDFIGQRKKWYLASGLLLMICLASIVFRGFHYGIEFSGGNQFGLPVKSGTSLTAVRAAVEGAGAKVSSAQTAGSGDAQSYVIRTERLTDQKADDAQILKVKNALVSAGRVPIDQIASEEVSSSWGSEVTKQALIALVVFVVLVGIFMGFRFRDAKAAGAALLALIHDLILTAGVYSIVGFEVTPATVVGLLTILGYSLYDTVVVFDKVRENTGELSSMSRLTYSEAANRAVNQTLVRSLNTSLASLLPIGALLVVGAVLLGAETIKDLSLALFVGVAAGTYSSIFIATPFLALWKETEPRNRQLTARVARLAGAGGRRRKDDGGRRPAEEAPVLEADAPNGLHLEADEEIEEVEEPARAAAPAPRQPQKPRPAQQRRKSSGRQPSRSAKRRRR